MLYTPSYFYWPTSISVFATLLQDPHLDNFDAEEFIVAAKDAYPLVNEWMISNQTLLHDPPINLGWLDDAIGFDGVSELKVPCGP